MRNVDGNNESLNRLFGLFGPLTIEKMKLFVDVSSLQ
jgi:hypothetical protein